MDDAQPGWPDEAWLHFLLGVDSLAHDVARTFDETAWTAPPVAGAPAEDDDLVDFLLGLDELARRLATLGDRCADAAPPSDPDPQSPLTGSLLR